MSASPARFFLDTNIFAYTFDDRDPAIRAKAIELIETALTTGLGMISYQVIQEFLIVAGTKFASPLTVEDRRAYLEEVLMPLCQVWPGRDLYLRALDIQSTSGYGFYDSLIVAAALRGGCRTLYTQDLQHGRRFDVVTVVDPFAV